ncbi:hypothetical protein [Algoriphagus sp. CAU 1675]|uniref:hypothetical protein n=1 Tax=Algoriphagus sp. CAU 1675 TaxID=3032597 RepID=UPI0023DCB026|nr:hypothetical protein [Algoriphagus sp. CAU 1675]MDF2157028.1 hypothetical protein [Algoriphagus sp. CAU 1675]
MKALKIAFSLALILMMGSCGPNTKILGSWTNPNKPAGGYESIFVTALTDNILARRTVETDLEHLLQAEGVNARSSFEVMPPGFKSDGVDKDEILHEIRQYGSDAILTIALLEKTTETRYVPGTTTVYSPMVFRYHGRFWVYYNYYNPIIYDPGYYTTDKSYYLEANLYDSESEELMWSSQSETTNPYSLDSFSEDFSEVVVGQLKKNGLIR